MVPGVRGFHKVIYLSIHCQDSCGSEVTFDYLFLVLDDCVSMCLLHSVVRIDRWSMVVPTFKGRFMNFEVNHYPDVHKGRYFQPIYACTLTAQKVYLYPKPPIPRTPQTNPPPKKPTPKRPPRSSHQNQPTHTHPPNPTPATPNPPPLPSPHTLRFPNSSLKASYHTSRSLP